MYDYFKKLFDEAMISPSFRLFMRDPYGGANGFAFPHSIVTFGATRGVLIPDDPSIDWVVKFDVESDGTGASICEREAACYAAAKRHSLTPYFASLEPLGIYKWSGQDYEFDAISILRDYGDDDFEIELEKLLPLPLTEVEISFSIFKAQRADCVMPWCFSSHPQRKQYIMKFPSPLAAKYEEIGEEFLRLYGEEEYNRLTKFCQSWLINDIHYGNIGYIKDKLVLIDYAGYLDEEDSLYRGADVESAKL